MIEERKFIESWKFAILGVTIVFVLVYPLIFRDPFEQNLLIQVFLFILLGQSWNIVGGYAGQWSLGHTLYFGIGAYTSALLVLWFELTPWIGMFAAIAMAMLAATIIGLPCFRLRTHWFAMATLLSAELVRAFSLQPPIDTITNGALGLVFPKKFAEQSYIYMLWLTKEPYYYLSLSLAVLAVLIVITIERSRFGIYLKAIREDEEAAENLGINTTLYKLYAFQISAALTALGGVFYVHYIWYIDPYAAFPLLLSVTIMLVPILGGTGTVLGPVIGALILMPLAEYTRIWLGAGGVGTNYVLYGAIIVLLVTYSPGGVLSILRKRRSFKSSFRRR